MKKILISTILLSILLLSGCGKQETLRAEKDRKSADEGLNRILTVYDQNGKVIKTYEGKFDIDSNGGESGSSGTKIKFDIPTGDGDGTKRVIIYNAIVICEEE